MHSTMQQVSMQQEAAPPTHTPGYPTRPGETLCVQHSCLAAQCQQGGVPITTTRVRLKELDGGAFGVTVLCTKGAGEYGRLATAASGLLCPMRRSKGAQASPRAGHS